MTFIESFYCCHDWKQKLTFIDSFSIMNSSLASFVKNWPEDGFSYVSIVSGESAKVRETKRNLPMLLCSEKSNEEKLTRKNIWKIH